jgi:antitoxin HigA-1
MPMHRPSHPGEMIREEVLSPLDLNVTKAASVLGVTRPALSRLLNEKAALSPEMALRIEKAFGPKADHLMRIQLAYDMARARKKAGQLQVSTEYAQRQPV